jgi:hypothetical protein
MKESCLFMAERLSKTRLAAGKLILTADKFQRDKHVPLPPRSQFTVSCVCRVCVSCVTLSV